MLRSDKTLNTQVVGTSVADYLAIKYFYAHQRIHIRVAFFCIYRQIKRKNKIYGLTNKEIRSKVVSHLCRKLHKLNIEFNYIQNFLINCDGEFLHLFEGTLVEKLTCRNIIQVLESVSIPQLEKLKEAGIFYPCVDFRRSEVIK